MSVLLGSHMSIAGGLYRAVERAAEVGCDVVQIFTQPPQQWACKPAQVLTKNNNQWAAKPITESECSLFKESLARTGVSRPLSHSSYLINLASPKDELWHKSIESMVVEWQRAELLGLDGVVLHPGSFVESTPEAGLERIAIAIQQVYEKVAPKSAWLLLENTAGQGSNLGWNMEQLGWLLERTGEAMQVGVCLDTCQVTIIQQQRASRHGRKRPRRTTYSMLFVPCT